MANLRTRIQLVPLAALSVFLASHAARAASDLELVPASAVPTLLAEGDLPALRLALAKQATACRAQDPRDTFEFGERVATREEWCVRSADRLVQLIDRSRDMAELELRARGEFEWYRSKGSDGQGTVKYTAYDTPSLDGSLAPVPGFMTPIYHRPADLVQVMVDGKAVWRRRLADGTYAMHDDRRQIDLGGSLAGQGLEVAWARDPVEVYFLQVEGSGTLRVAQPDGSIQRVRLHYDASNGHPYVSLGRLMREQGVPERYLSIPGMKRWFREHPEQMWPNLVKNPSYVYFVPGEGDPMGSSDLALTARHSLAVDPTWLPMSAIALIHVERPLGPGPEGDEVTGWQDFTSLALTQDIGGAIMGPGRVDMYWGEDDYASFASGTMSRNGTLYFALIKPGRVVAPIEPGRARAPIERRP